MTKVNVEVTGDICACKADSLYVDKLDDFITFRCLKCQAKSKVDIADFANGFKGVVIERAHGEAVVHEKRFTPYDRSLLKKWGIEMPEAPDV